MTVYHLVTNRCWGGGERYALDICRSLREDGHDVTVLVRDIPEVETPFRDAGIPTRHIRPGGMFDFWTPLQLAKIWDSHGTETVNVHVHNFKDAATALRARSLCRNARVRVICTRHIAKPAKTSAAHLAVYNGLDEIVFVSQLTRDTFLSTAPAIEHPERLKIIHNSIRDWPREISNTYSDNSLNIIFAGRIVPEKGLDILLKALEDMGDRPWHLHVCGTGNSRYTMPLVRRTRANGLDKHITWHGHINNISEIICRCHAGVVPSSAPEAFGLVMLEYMSHALPVIATDNGAATEIITDGEEGLLIAPSDSAALAQALKSLADSPQLRQTMGTNARRTFLEKFTWPGFYRAITSLYR